MSKMTDQPNTIVFNINHLNVDQLSIQTGKEPTNDESIASLLTSSIEKANADLLAENNVPTDLSTKGASTHLSVTNNVSTDLNESTKKVSIDLNESAKKVSTDLKEATTCDLIKRSEAIEKAIKIERSNQVQLEHRATGDGASTGQPSNGGGEQRSMNQQNAQSYKLEARVRNLIINVLNQLSSNLIAGDHSNDKLLVEQIGELINHLLHAPISQQMATNRTAVQCSTGRQVQVVDLELLLKEQIIQCLVDGRELVAKDVDDQSKLNFIKKMSQLTRQLTDLEAREATNDVEAREVTNNLFIQKGPSINDVARAGNLIIII